MYGSRRIVERFTKSLKRLYAEGSVVHIHSIQEPIICLGSVEQCTVGTEGFVPVWLEKRLRFAEAISYRSQHMSMAWFSRLTGVIPL